MNNTTKGILWMLAHCLAITVFMLIARQLGNGVNSYIMLFWQNIFGSLIMVPFCLVTSGWPKTKVLHLQAARSISGISSCLILFYGMKLIPLNIATSISFLGPLFTTLFVIIFLKEKAQKHRIIGLFIGFIGVLVVLRPGTAAFNPNSLWMVLTAMNWGITDVLIKMLNRTEKVKTMLFYKTVFMTLFTIPLGIIFWQTVTIHQLLLILALSVTDLLNIGTVTIAYKKADIGVLMPFDFSRLVFSSILAYAVFNETLSAWTLAGSAIIVYGTLFVVYTEKKKSKLTATVSG